MKVIVLDLEMNQPSGRIIQIGAVVLDLRGDRVVDRLNLYVDPMEPVDPSITELTGIGEDEMKQAMSYPAALTALSQWISGHDSRLGVAWGTDFDIILQDMKDLSVLRPHKFRKLDLKAAFQVIRAGVPSGKLKGGLGATLTFCDLPFTGRPHNALADALNTAKLIVYLRHLQLRHGVVKRGLTEPRALTDSPRKGWTL